MNHNNNLKINGFEIDENIYEKAKINFNNNQNVSINLSDFMYNDWDNKYDSIICNPTYINFHNYDNKNILNEIEKRISFKTQRLNKSLHIISCKIYFPVK
ncbi:MAG: hypothetical protein IPG78_10595 [Ignavibacteria bacterium]|nr:hypothetical protein [Ignavibacteria bacterium]